MGGKKRGGAKTDGTGKRNRKDRSRETMTKKACDLRDMMLLDNQSTTDIFCNRRLLTNVWETEETMTIHSNGGLLSTNKKGCLRN